MSRPASGELRARVRQWRYPRALRIAPREVPGGLDELVDEANAALRAALAGPKPAAASLDDGAVVAIATGLWRTRRRMIDRATGEADRALRRPFRHLQSTWDALEEAGVVIQDHDGSRWNSGLTLEVLAFQPTAGLLWEQVIETVRPSVYLDGRTVQIGQVIVGTPDDGTPDDGTSDDGTAGQGAAGGEEGEEGSEP
jgi:hypothetical protein